MNMDIRYALIALATSFVAAGCWPLGPRPDNTPYFSLAPLAKADERSAASNARQPLTIGVGLIDFPDYLRGTQIVTRNRLLTLAGPSRSTRISNVRCARTFLHSCKRSG
jgi:hypothetical protein